jgi:hypothetical protein
VAGVRPGSGAAPPPPGPVATFVRMHLRGLRIGAVALAVLAFVFLEQPTGAAILVIAALLLVVLAVLEFLGRPVESPPAEPVTAPDGAEPAAATAETTVPEARRG